MELYFVCFNKGFVFMICKNITLEYLLIINCFYYCQSLIESINMFLTGDCPTGLKKLALKFMLVLVTVSAFCGTLCLS